MKKEFTLKAEVKTERTTKEGVDVYYNYRFTGNEDNEKMNVKSDKKMNLARGAVIAIDFKDIQTIFPRGK